MGALGARKPGNLRLHGELIVEIARLLQISTDQLVGQAAAAPETGSRNRRLARRLQALEKLSKRDQEALLRTIDAFVTKAS